MARRRLISPSQPAAILIGGLLFLGGSYFLWEAWEGRGQQMPRLLRPFGWW